MASKLNCILSLAKTKYFFATIFCRYISFNVIEAILSENLLIVIFFKFYSQLSSRITSIGFQKQASCAQRLIYANNCPQISQQDLICFASHGLSSNCSGAPNDSFLPHTLKTLSRLSRVLLDLQKCIPIGAAEFESVRSSQGNLSLFEITRASVLFSRQFQVQFKVLQN